MMKAYKRTAAVIGAAAMAVALARPATAAASVGCSGSGITVIRTTPTESGAFGVTAGPGGTWYADGDRIVRVRANGTQDQFPVPDPDQASIGWLSWSGGPDVWFSDRGIGQLGRIDGTGHVVEYQVPDAPGGASPNGQVT